MAKRNQNTSPEQTGNDGDADGALDGAQEAADTINEQGYLGTKVDPRPNSDYSLESGPDSPSASDAVRVSTTDLENRD